GRTSGLLRPRYLASQDGRLCVVRSEGLEPPRFYSLPPQGSASTNSATSAPAEVRECQRQSRTSGLHRRQIPSGADQGRHVTNQRWRDKALSTPPNGRRGLPLPGGPGQHLLDFDGNAVA